MPGTSFTAKSCARSTRTRASSRIDTAAAKQLAGVEAVLTAQDIPGEKVIGIVVKNQAILAGDKVRYLGDGVALVAARTREIAEAAVKLIKVDYEPLPVVSDPEAALAPDAPKIHGEDNTFVHHKVRKGDVAKGFARGGLHHRAEVPDAVHRAFLPRTGGGAGRAGRARRSGGDRQRAESLFDAGARWPRRSSWT